MFMDPGMDTGDIILQASEMISAEDTAGTLAERLAPLGARLLTETLELLAEGDAPRVKQDTALATYAPMLKREDGYIDWKEPATAIQNRIHGCNPSPGAVAERDGRAVKLWRARVDEQMGTPTSNDPGTVVRIERGGPLVATGSGLVQLIEVQPESRPRLSGEEYARGYRLVPGERFTTPSGGQAIGPVS